MSQTTEPPKTVLQKLLDGVETVGNKVPHPAVIFLVLIGIVVLLSHVFYVLGTSVPYQCINPQTHDIEDLTAIVKSLLSADGIRLLLTSAVRNFLNFGPVGVILVAMVGVGLAEEAGLIGALIHKLIHITPRRAITFIREMAKVWEAIFPLVEPPRAGEAYGVIFLHSNARSHVALTNAIGVVTPSQLRALKLVLQTHPRHAWIILLHHHVVEHPGEVVLCSAPSARAEGCG
jgi:aminobenzoyl-glutamate transport protein